MALVVTLGTLTIGDDVVDANGATWHLNAIEGWDSPELRTVLHALPGEDRQAIGPIFYNARAISVVGECQTPTEAIYWASKAKLMGATNLTGSSGNLTVSETTAKKIAVYRAGRVLMKPIHSLVGFTYEIPLIAPDPRILASTGSNLTPPGTATNTGNFRAAPVLAVNGSAAGPIVISRTYAGVTRTVTVSTSVPVAQQLVIDFKARSILLNGVNRYDLVASVPAWWELEPGNNTIAYTGGGTPSLTWNDSWI